MKKMQKTGIALGIALMIALVAAGIFFYVTKRPVIAFYRLQDREIDALKNVIGDEFDYRTYNNDTSLYSQTKKRPDLIFTTTGSPLKSATQTAKKVPISLLSDMTSSVRDSVPQEEDTVSAVPVLSSHLEIDINMTMLRRTSIKTISTWKDIEAFAIEAQKQFPEAHILFAGKNGALVLDIIGALAEALGSKKDYDAAVALIDQAIEDNAWGRISFNGDAVAETLAGNPDAPLYDAVRFLNKWYKAGLIDENSFKINKNAISALMNQEMVSVAFMSLSDHRAIDNNTIRSYTSIYFPSDNPASTRNFTAPIIVAVPQTANKKTLVLVQRLVSEELQETLSRNAGLAPVLARCRTPDHQADDARYWVAATNAPLAGLSRENTLSDEQLQSLGTGLAMLIRTGK